MVTVWLTPATKDPGLSVKLVLDIHLLAQSNSVQAVCDLRSIFKIESYYIFVAISHSEQNGIFLGLSFSDMMGGYESSILRM